MARYKRSFSLKYDFSILQTITSRDCATAMSIIREGSGDTATRSPNNSALNAKSNICHENFTPDIARSSKVAISTCHLRCTGVAAIRVRRNV